MRRQDLNSQPSDYESPPLNAGPGLALAHFSDFFFGVRFLSVMKASNVAATIGFNTRQHLAGINVLVNGNRRERLKPDLGDSENTHSLHKGST